jgi:hypothetical protein
MIACNIPGKEVDGRGTFSPQEVQESRIPYSEYGYLSARAFIMERAGRIIDHLGCFLRMIIPVL